MKNILFLYTGGRKKRVDSPIEDFPKDFFYGYYEFKKLGFQVDFVERIIPSSKPKDLKYRWLDLHNEFAAKQLVMGNNAPFFLPHLSTLKKADIIISIGDSIALAPEYFKMRGWINAKLIHVSMGLANYWSEALKKGNAKKFWVKWYYNRLLNYADAIITLGEAETSELKRFFPKQKPKIEFIPFGVDTDFWTPDSQVEKNIDVLFIGNDNRRDYKLLSQIPTSMPHVSFTYVTKHLKKENLSHNVTFHDGSWRENGLTDVEIRQLYRQAKIVINPIIETLQPSGQSVTLQAMSCACPVIISKFSGFWEPNQYSDETICEVNHSLNDWQNAIQNLLHDNKKLKKLSKNGLELTNKLYSSNKMISRYLDVIHKLDL